MKVVILCGGKGTRLREETEFKPKPLVEIGGIPLLIHLMKIYASQGFTEFILCLGYKGHLIRKYFLEHRYMMNDFTLDMGSGRVDFHSQNFPHLAQCKVTFVETGEDTLTGGRVKKIQSFVKNEDFMLTYGDGVADINLKALVDFHQQNKKISTITGINPTSKYGLIQFNNNYEVSDFAEKPVMNDIINGGFLVLKPAFFDYITEDCMFESKVLPILSKERQVGVYHHKGFWHCLDTYKDYEDLNHLWQQSRPWEIPTNVPPL